MSENNNLGVRIFPEWAFFGTNRSDFFWNGDSCVPFAVTIPQHLKSVKVGSFGFTNSDGLKIPFELCKYQAIQWLQQNVGATLPLAVSNEFIYPSVVQAGIVSKNLFWFLL